MNKVDFHEWKDHPVTEEILAVLQDRVEQMQYIIAHSIGDDPKQDLINRGYIMGIEDLLKIQFEEEPQLDD